MTPSITAKFPAPWICEQDTFEDESGVEIAHLEAGRDEGRWFIDVYAGEMPEDMTAADQALSNYADMVGFDDDDPEDFNPISEWMFNGRKAYGFKAFCEDESPMLFMSYEPKKGVLCIASIMAPDDDKLEEASSLLEKVLRISTNQLV